MHDKDFQSVQQLIALKRHEHPDDTYFEELLEEFHRRQRQDLLNRSSRSLFVERLGTWFSGTSKWSYVMGAGAAYAAIFFAAMFFWPSPEVKLELNTAPIKHETQKEDMLKPDKDKEPVREVY